jgi:hypothetical protein
MLSQSLYNIPTQTIYIDPPTLDPTLLWLCYEIDKFGIVKVMDVDIVLAEIDNGDLTFFMEIWGVRSSAIRFRGIEAWLLSWMPRRSQRGNIHSLEAQAGISSRLPTPQHG